MSQTTQRASIPSPNPSLNDGDEMNSDEERTAFFESLIPSTSSKPKFKLPPLSRYPSSSSTAPSSSPSKPSISLEDQSESSLSLKLNLKRPLASFSSSSSLSNVKSDDRPLKKPTPNFYRDSSIRGIVKNHIPPSTSALSKKRKSSTLSYEDLLPTRPMNRGSRPEISSAIVPKPPAARPKFTHPTLSVTQRSQSTEYLDADDGPSIDMQVLAKKEKAEAAALKYKEASRLKYREAARRKREAQMAEELAQKQYRRELNKLYRTPLSQFNDPERQIPAVSQEKSSKLTHPTTFPTKFIPHAIMSDTASPHLNDLSRPVAPTSKANSNDTKTLIPPSPSAAPPNSIGHSDRTTVSAISPTHPIPPPAYTISPQVTPTAIATHEEALKRFKKDNELLRDSLHSSQTKIMAQHRLLTKERQSHMATQALLAQERTVNQRNQLSGHGSELHKYQADLLKQLQEQRTIAQAAERKSLNFENRLRSAEHNNRNLIEQRDKYKSDFEVSKRVNIRLLGHAEEYRKQRSDIIEVANKATKQIQSMKVIIDKKTQDLREKTYEMCHLEFRLSEAERQNRDYAMKQ